MFSLSIDAAKFAHASLFIDRGPRERNRNLPCQAGVFIHPAPPPARGVVLVGSAYNRLLRIHDEYASWDGEWPCATEDGMPGVILCDHHYGKAGGSIPYATMTRQDNRLARALVVQFDEYGLVDHAKLQTTHGPFAGERAVIRDVPVMFKVREAYPSAPAYLALACGYVRRCYSPLAHNQKEYCVDATSTYLFAKVNADLRRGRRANAMDYTAIGLNFRLHPDMGRAIDVWFDCSSHRYHGLVMPYVYDRSRYGADYFMADYFMNERDYDVEQRLAAE